jgi:hypothetical protein
MGMKQKKKIQKKFQNGRLKKTEFFKTTNSQKKIVKILWIGLGLVELIDVAQPIWL